MEETERKQREAQREAERQRVLQLLQRQMAAESAIEDEAKQLLSGRPPSVVLRGLEEEDRTLRTLKTQLTEELERVQLEETLLRRQLEELKSGRLSDSTAVVGGAGMETEGDGGDAALEQLLEADLAQHDMQLTQAEGEAAPSSSAAAAAAQQEQTRSGNSQSTRLGGPAL